jgi:hypothetical protein
MEKFEYEYNGVTYSLPKDAKFLYTRMQVQKENNLKITNMVDFNNDIGNQPPHVKQQISEIGLKTFSEIISKTYTREIFDQQNISQEDAHADMIYEVVKHDFVEKLMGESKDQSGK